MAFMAGAQGGQVSVELPAGLYKLAHDANLSVPQYINKHFAEGVDLTKGTPFQQLCASEGLFLGNNAFGLRPPTLDDVLNGRSGMQAAGNTNVNPVGSPFGSASRLLFPAAIVAMIETELQKDRTTDGTVFNDMVALEMSIGSETFEQPVINYNTASGPQQVRSQRIAQLAEPARVMQFTTADRSRRLPVWSFGAEFSHQALRASTLDIVALTMARLMEVERDAHVYEYMSSIWTGDNDLNTGAVSAVTTNSLDSNATSGIVTHKAWLKFLARNRKYRKVTHLIGDIDAYLAVEGRTGRPGSNNYDPTLARVDPQARVVNVGFGNDVKWFIVDSAAEGGPVPANTIWALDASRGIVRVRNTAASYEAAEDFVMSRKQAMRIDWSEDVYRMFGNTELRAFDVLTIS